MPDDGLRAQVGVATHDLANAIGAVLNYATFLDEDLAGTDAAEVSARYLPHLRGAAERALASVTTLAAALAPDAERD